MSNTDNAASAADARARQWSALRLSTGFYLADMVRELLQFADTSERTEAIKTACRLLDSGCDNEQEWRSAIDTLRKLCRQHPDAYKESGTWYDGDASLLSLAAAMEAARLGLYRLHPSLYEDRIKGTIYKVFKYTLRAMMQKPETATFCLQWVERNVNL